MRYEDWDVLLFQGPGSENCRVPLREFKTQCHAVEDVTLLHHDFTHEHAVGPLMTCFVPSILEDAPFQISVHSWTPRPFFFPHAQVTHTGDARASHVWRVKVNVDGADVCQEHYSSSETWPKCLTVASQREANGNLQPLRFPRFYKSVMSQQTWDAVDSRGRIKIEISEGYMEHEGEDQIFHKLANHAMFNFQPAPFEVLQRAGIAFPNPAIFQRPIRFDPNIPFGLGPAFIQRPDHQRNVSTSSINSLQSSPLGNYAPAFAPPGLYANSSRSTSAYTNIPLSALPLPVAAAVAAANAPVQQPTHTGPQQVRLPSDQLDKILNALSTPRAVDNTMPPPSLPQHLVTAVQTSEIAMQNDESAMQTSESGTKTDTTEPPSTHNRRAANCSDVSMHPDCSSYPACTTEDSEGRVVHSPPAQEVRGRKKATIENNNRDFFSNILNPAPTDSFDDTTQVPSPPATRKSIPPSSPANGTVRKRTRSTTKRSEGNAGKEDEKGTPKPSRKVSRALTKFDKENVTLDEERMVLDS